MLNTDYSRAKAPNLATSTPTRSLVIPFVAHLLCSLLPFMPLLRRLSRLNKTVLSFARIVVLKCLLLLFGPSSLLVAQHSRFGLGLLCEQRKVSEPFPSKNLSTSTPSWALAFLAPRLSPLFPLMCFDTEEDGPGSPLSLLKKKSKKFRPKAPEKQVQESPSPAASLSDTECGRRAATARSKAEAKLREGGGRESGPLQTSCQTQ